ncbi:MAG: hypothetical protein HYR91_01715 [Flavobacteriia bacterium]|nr:hypothetical protein [Flavobacteriia bacterium]
MSHISKEALIWKGKFSYNPEEYGEVDDVNFEMYVSIKNGEFEGVSYDDEFRDLYPELPKVKGKITANEIHFVIVYPVSYSVDDDNQISIDVNQKGHEVIYNGIFYPNQNLWKGEWEILPHEETHGDEIIYQNYSSGEWEMSED